jgi:hypothetical protein
LGTIHVRAAAPNTVNTTGQIKVLSEGYPAMGGHHGSEPFKCRVGIEEWDRLLVRQGKLPDLIDIIKVEIQLLLKISS